TYPCSALSILGKIIVGSYQWKTRLARRHTREPLPAPYRLGKILPHHFPQLRLGIKRFQLRYPTALKKINDPLRLGCKMRQSRNHSLSICTAAGEQIRYQQRTQCSASNTDTQPG